MPLDFRFSNTYKHYDGNQDVNALTFSATQPSQVLLQLYLILSLLNILDLGLAKQFLRRSICDQKFLHCEKEKRG